MTAECSTWNIRGFEEEPTEMFHVEQNPRKTFHVEHSYDVVVVGGGHAGCEAALAASRMGSSVLLLSQRPDRIAEMSCNPSIGGVGKGQLVRELDALGGEMGKAADETGIQWKRLNTRKGGAVQSSRCQSDKKLYAERMRSAVSAQKGLTVAPGEVRRLVVENDVVVGIEGILNGESFSVATPHVVLTTGTFLQAIMHCGPKTAPGGRFGESPALGLSDELRRLGFPLHRLKTGTPARLLRDSIDWTQMEEQWGDPDPRRFSFSATNVGLPQVPCHLTATNARTHDVIRQNLDKSPLYSGQILGVGPRYCPSIEDKVVKFPDKERHPLFFEPEALDSDWIYPNGVSTSLPPEVQEAFLRTIPGCERVEIVRHGYAVEYDCVDARELTKSFESRRVRGLFFAGQINGTSGYEEAAIQGLWAGAQAALSAQKRPAAVLGRTEAYLGVLVDDLTRSGITEPYRMFTSRAEYRLSLREDNADLRLRPLGRELGLVGDDDWQRFLDRRDRLEKARAFLVSARVPIRPDTQVRLQELGTTPLSESCTALALLRRPQIGIADLLPWLGPEAPVLSADDAETLEIGVKYEGYLGVQELERARLERLQTMPLAADFPYRSIGGLSHELREKLLKKVPTNLAEAAEIPGMTPAALSALLAWARRGDRHASKAV